MPSPIINKDQERMNEIYKITSILTQNQSNDFSEILAISCDFLKLDTGLISYVEENDFTVTDFYSVNPDVKLKNKIFDLNDTFCKITLKENKVVDVHNAGVSPYSHLPCFTKFSTKAYIGIPLWLDGDQYGTLCFISDSTKNEEFNQTDRDFVQYLGQWIINCLSKKNYEKQIAERKEELKTFNKQLEEKNENLHNIMQEKDQLIQILVHDLKSPLSNIKMLAYLFEEMVNNKESKELFTIFNRSLQNVFHLINQMETINNMENLPNKVTLEDIDLQVSVLEILANFSKSAEVKNIKLNFVDDNKETISRTDINILTRILNNLISNAIKFSPFDKKVDITLTSTDYSVSIAVKDEGPGILQTEKGKLFNKFSSLSNKPTNNESSSGLGLFIVKELLKILKGEIIVESEPNSGSCFTIVLPKNISFE